MLLFSADKTIVIVLSNAHDSASLSYCDRALRLVLPAVARNATPIESSPRLAVLHS